MGIVDDGTRDGDALFLVFRDTVIIDVDVGIVIVGYVNDEFVCIGCFCCSDDLVVSCDVVGYVRRDVIVYVF